MLVGHSIAGEELSSIGSRYPKRVAGLIYLDAGYAYAFYNGSRGDLNIDLIELLNELEQLLPGQGPADTRPLVQDLLTTSLPSSRRTCTNGKKMCKARLRHRRLPFRRLPRRSRRGSRSTLISRFPFLLYTPSHAAQTDRLVWTPPLASPFRPALMQESQHKQQLLRTECPPPGSCVYPTQRTTFSCRMKRMCCVRSTHLSAGCPRVAPVTATTRRGPFLLEELGRDVNYGVRALRRSAAFTLLAVLTLAVGIGASTAVVSVVRGVLLRPLPVRNQGDLVAVWLEPTVGGAAHLPIAYQDLTAFRARSRAFESVGGVNFQGAVDLVMLNRANPVTLAAAWVTGDFFSVLGVEPARGRTLRPSDDVLGAAPVMVISYGFWQRQFGGDLSALGQALDWNGKSYTIVGILPRDFEYPKRAEAWFAVIPWFPATANPTLTESPPIQFDLVGRLGHGASIKGATDDYLAFIRSTDQERPLALRGQRPIVTLLPELITGGMGAILWTGSAAVGLLLLISCVNVANLLLIRGSARAQELAIRATLGAARGRLARQLLIESSIMGILAGVIGVAVAFGAVRVLVALAPPELPRRDVINVDGPVLVIALAVGVGGRSLCRPAAIISVAEQI